MTEEEIKQEKRDERERILKEIRCWIGEESRYIKVHNLLDFLSELEREE